MMPLRVPVESVGAGNTVVVLNGEAAHYVLRVHRARPGDALELFDGAGAVVRAVLDRADRGAAHVRTGDVRTVNDIPRPRVTIVQSVPRLARLDDVVQKGTELGAAAFWALTAERSVRRPDDDHAAARARRIAVEACRQCGRVVAPEIGGPFDADEVARRLPLGATAFVLDGRAPRSLVAALRAAPPTDDVYVAVGPEGGWADREVHALTAAGFLPVHMGARVLRTETAGPAAVAVIAALCGEWDRGGAS